MKLITTPNISDADGLYQKLIALHLGRSEADSMRVNARLILLLVNHIGDTEAVEDAMSIAADKVNREDV